MAESILQTFLNQQFIKTSDGGNIDSLKKAVTTVVTALSKNRKLIIAYTLVALDPQISESEPIVGEVEKTIIKNWPTFKNNTSTKDKATTYVRIVILQALSELMKDNQLQAIIWLTGRNVISYYKTQKEKQVISTLLLEMGNSFEMASRKQWSVGALKKSSVKPLNIVLPATKRSLISEEELTAELKAASNHSGWVTQGGGGENPSYPSAGDWNWAKFFSERLGGGLTPLLNNAIGGQEKTLNTIVSSIQSEVNDHIKQFENFLEEASIAMGESFSAANKRGDLLWWKQTLYSSYLGTSYRAQTDISSAISMAYDLSTLLGLMYPESANHLLREALRDVYGNTIDSQETFEFWLNKILAIPREAREILVLLSNTTDGRKSLGAFVANTLNTNTIENFQSETGIELTQELSLADLSVWILHDIQAAKFSNQK